MDWRSHNYEVLTTADGSPSLKYWRDPALVEAYETMHHSAGAWGETLYIYGTALRLLRDLGRSADSARSGLSGRVMSLGLGLGYNELLVAAALGNSLESLTSFESDPFLWECFNSAIAGLALSREIQEPYEAIFSFVRARFAEFSPSSMGLLPHWGKFGVLNAGWVSVTPPQGWNCILYDAYSAKTNVELWDEEFLVDLLRRHAGEVCVFATYACRGSLKRALTRTGFVIVERPAFHGKRNCTLALRGGSVDLVAWLDGIA